MKSIRCASFRIASDGVSSTKPSPPKLMAKKWSQRISRTETMMEAFREESNTRPNEDANNAE
jgi:hypothetical protein